MKTNDNISNSNEGCISSDTLLKYIKGELSGLEKNRIERHLASCEMCSDELKGLLNMKDPKMIEQISLELNQKIDVLTAKPEREILYLGLYIRIAASIILTLGVSTVIYLATFRKSPALLPSYALMEVAQEVPSPPPPQGSSNDMALKSFEGETKMENLELAENREARVGRGKVKGNAKNDEAVKYVAPVIVDSIVSDNAIDEVKEDVMANSEVTDEFIVVAASQAAAESIISPAPASADKKSSLAVGGQAIRELIVSANKSKDSAISPTYNALKKAAINRYSKRKYAEALATFNTISKDFPDKDTIVFYSSLCCYHLNRFNETIIKIAVFANNPKSVFYSQAKWYYSLALIGVDRTEEARVILEQIIRDDSSFKDKAKKELKKLNGR